MGAIGVAGICRTLLSARRMVTGREAVDYRGLLRLDDFWGSERVSCAPWPTTTASYSSSDRAMTRCWISVVPS
jgi:hypothetical protein